MIPNTFIAGFVTCLVLDILFSFGKGFVRGLTQRSRPKGNQ